MRRAPFLLLPLLVLVGALAAPAARAGDTQIVVYNKGKTLRYDPDVGAELKEVFLETYDCSTGKLAKKETIEAYFHLSDDKEIITPDATLKLSLCFLARRLLIHTTAARGAAGAITAQTEEAMNWDTLKGKWEQFAGQFKSKWGKLTDDDLTTIGGKKDELVGKLQERYGYEKDKAETELDEFTRSLDKP